MSSQVEIHMKKIEIMVNCYITSECLFVKDVEILIIMNSHGMYHLPWKGWQEIPRTKAVVGCPSKFTGKGTRTSPV